MVRKMVVESLVFLTICEFNQHGKVACQLLGCYYVGRDVPSASWPPSHALVTYHGKVACQLTGCHVDIPMLCNSITYERNNIGIFVHPFHKCQRLLWGNANSPNSKI